MKKRNMLRKITAIILAVTMLIPTNIYADDNYYYYDEIKPTDDPNVFIDNYGNLKNISDLEIYYNHPHWTKIKEKGKGVDNYFETIPATTERDGVVRVSCDFCETRYLRIPRIKTVKNRNAKYT